MEHIIIRQSRNDVLDSPIVTASVSSVEGRVIWPRIVGAGLHFEMRISRVERIRMERVGSVKTRAWMFRWIRLSTGRYGCVSRAVDEA